MLQNISTLDLPKQTSTIKTIAWSTLVSGVLDATAGVVVYWIFKGLNPLQVLQYIASGIFGASVINGSFIYVIAGLLLHFIIAFAFAAAYFIAYPFIKSFAKNAIVSGILYGAFIWLFMNYVVLPNSNTPQSPKNFVSIIELVWHMALVGLPIAVITKKHFDKIS
jgi:ABC-type transport system involved in multi-copper enzyme maturation permease subunit